MSWLKKDLRLISNTAEEELFEALSSTPYDPQAGGGEAEQGEWLSRSEEGSQMHLLGLHRAAFEGDLEELRRLLPGLSLRQKLQLDPHGNTALHVAVLAHRHEAIKVLLEEGGFPPDVKNQRRWNPVDEAVALGDAAATKMLYSRLLACAKQAKRQKKAQLVALMEQLPDFRMQLRWELGSPLFGLLLRHYAPDDTYTVTKVGNLLRVDGTLMGLDDKHHSFIPKWKRGRFSLLVNGGATPTAAYLVDHSERSYYDLYRERKAHLKSVDEEVADMLAAGAGKVRLADADVDFKPLKNWLGRVKTEKVDGWETEVYEASGSLVAATWEKVPVLIPPGASWEEYLEMELPGDVVQEVPLDPLSPPEKPKAKSPGTATSASPASTPRAAKAAAAGARSAAAPPGSPTAAVGQEREEEEREAALAAAAIASLKARAAEPAGPATAFESSLEPATPQAAPARTSSSSTFASCRTSSTSSRGSGSGAFNSAAASPAPSGSLGGNDDSLTDSLSASASGSLEGSRSGGFFRAASWRGGKQGRGKGEGQGSPAAQQQQQQHEGQEAQQGSGGKGKGKGKKARTFSSRCWLAKNYPISLAQIIPLLEVVAAGNRHFAQAAEFLKQFRSDEYFPVRVQVPLVWTVYLMLSFRQFELLKPGDEAMRPGYFDIPAGYKLDRMEEGDLVEKKVASPLMQRLDGSGNGGGDGGGGTSTSPLP